MRFEKLNEKELMKNLPADLAGKLEGEVYVVPRATARELAGLGRVLVKKAPKKLSSLETATLEGVLQGCEYLDLVMAHNKRIAPAMQLKAPRLKVIKEVAAVKGVLKLMATSEAVEVAEEAQRLLSTLFTGDLDRVHVLGPRGVWHTVMLLDRELHDEATTRASLAELVPVAMTERLFVANTELGACFGLDTDEQPETPLGLREAKARMRRRVTRYAAALIASADEDDLALVRRAEKALRPIEELRDEVARRHGRKGAAAVVEEEGDEEEMEEEDDELGPVADGAPTPGGGGDG